MNTRPRRRRGEQGFVLAMTVWVLAALVLLAAYVDGVVSADRERARLAKQALEDDLAARGTEATLLYLLSTERRNHRGLVLERAQGVAPASRAARAAGDSVLGFAGEPYRGLGRVYFSIQDEDGLAAVNSPGTGVFRAVLRQAGVAPLAGEAFIAKLYDYIDFNDDLRLNGAERADYQAAGLGAPSNWFLASPIEMRRVHGAAAVIPPGAWPRLRRTTTAAHHNGPNFNTMSLAVLAAMFDGDWDAAARVAAFRERAPLRDVEMVAAISGYPVRPVGDFSALPSKRLRISLWREGHGRRSVVGVAITPGSIVAPWRKEYYYFEPVDRPDRQPAGGGSESARAADTPLFQPA